MNVTSNGWTQMDLGGIQIHMDEISFFCTKPQEDVANHYTYLFPKMLDSLCISMKSSGTIPIPYMYFVSQTLTNYPFVHPHDNIHATLSGASHINQVGNEFQYPIISIHDIIVWLNTLNAKFKDNYHTRFKFQHCLGQCGYDA